MRFGVSAAAAEIGLALFLAVVVSGGAAAQSSYPEKAVRIITNAPASLPDNVVRVVGQKLSELWGKPVVIENVAGAAGNVAAERVAKSAPDGHTLLFIGDAAVTTNVALYQSMPYDPLKDFAPVTMVANSVNILVVHPEVPAKNVAELVALAKAQPGKVTFASAGLGTSQHLGGELLKSMAGIDILHVPYKGMGPLLPDLLSGRVMMQFGNISTFLPLIREGKVRGIAVSSLKRAPQVPDLPTMDEFWFPRLRGDGVGRGLGAGRNPGGDRRQNSSGHRARAGDAGPTRQDDGHGLYYRRHDAAGVCRADQVGDRDEGQTRPRFRREAAITRARPGERIDYCCFADPAIAMVIFCVIEASRRARASRLRPASAGLQATFVQS